MNIQFITNSHIPASTYGGKERALWSLMRELNRRGHKVKLIAPEGSFCPFAEVSYPVPGLTSKDQPVAVDADLVHFDFPLSEEYVQKPYLARNGGNGKLGEKFALNTVFVSKNQAERHNGDFFIHNGIDPEEYGDPALEKKREYIHFLAKAAWRLKNLKDSITISKKAGEKLEVIGGKRLNFKMGFRFTADLHVHFNGLIGGEKKLEIIRGSKALIFPVLWHEPCANAVFESMYYGCPVFATSWGFLPELVTSETGFLTNSKTEMAEAIKNSGHFSRKRIHQYILDKHSIQRVADEYLKAYEKILNGEHLNTNIPQVTRIEPSDVFRMVD